MESCRHLEQINFEAEARTNGCEECEKTGDDWVALRLCLSCSHVGCCDSSKNKYGIKHFKATNHPVIQSFQPHDRARLDYLQVTLKK